MLSGSNFGLGFAKRIHRNEYFLKLSNFKFDFPIEIKNTKGDYDAIKYHLEYLTVELKFILNSGRSGFLLFFLSCRK